MFLRGGWDSRRPPQPLLNQTSVPSCLRVLRVNRAEPVHQRLGALVPELVPTRLEPLLLGRRVLFVGEEEVRKDPEVLRGMVVVERRLRNLRSVNTEHAEFRRHGECF